MSTRISDKEVSSRVRIILASRTIGGPLKTRAASGIADFNELIAKAQEKAPSRRLVSIEDVGVAVAFLSMNGAKLITGETLYIDGGYHIID